MMKSEQKRGIVYLVGAGPGDPGLITVKGIERLKEADVVVYDRLANHSLLAHARGAELIDVGKRPNQHKVPQDKINAILVEQAGQGKTVVRLKGGDPFVFGRGGEEAIALLQAGHDFEIVPGISSSLSAPLYAGIPVTHRNVACSVTITTGHRADNAATNVTCDWEKIACSADTLVFLMGVSNLPRIVDRLLTCGRPKDTPVALVERATRTTQKTVVGTLANIVEKSATIRPPAVIVVGQVVALREQLGWFDRPDRHPLLGLRVLNTRPLDQAASFSRELMALGAEPVELPTTQVVPLEKPTALNAAIEKLARLGEAWDWIVFTSVNSVTFFLDQLLAQGYDNRSLAGVKLLALGQTTAEILQSRGLRADFSLTHYLDDITTEIGDVSGRQILLPRSTVAQPDLVNVLQGRGAHVAAIETYAVESVKPDPISMATFLDGGVDVATFISPASVRSFAEMLDGNLVDLPAPLTVACIGPATAAAARSLGLEVNLIAEEHTIDGLLEALVRWHTSTKG